ncbi:hypothetical protein [Fulvivirga ligni]|uniref:hypothetical protein n=1 Tax=Fulvivirga ligni TaxID=2904246 RepID=UPI001F2C7C44|nr:hypothetical protein [Fulvivirga ligni]UII23187.1 hypothetical protein LVD16_08100 [Fulvivirga ligni]
MTNTKKYIIISLMTLTGLCILTVLVALRAQKTIHENYGPDYNQKRIELGVYPIDDFQNKENYYWEDFYPDDPFKRWAEILTNTEIVNSTTYINPDINDKPFHKQKTVFYGTHLCFWQNFHGGEIDLFVKPLDKERHIELFVAYYSDDLEPSNYFYAELDTVHNDTPEFICGGIVDHKHHKEYDIPKGNLTKQQADILLSEWKMKIK